MTKVRYVRMKEMTWPLPDFSEDGAAWKLHYAPEHLTTEDRYYLSSIVGAYAQMVTDTIKKRQFVIGELRKAIK